MKNRRFGRNLQRFRETYHVSAFGSTFRQKVTKSASFCEEALKIVDLAKTSQFFEQTNMFRHLGQLFGKKMENVPDFAKKHQKSSIWPKLATFFSRVPCFEVLINLSAKFAKSASFREKPSKFVDLAKTCNFLELTTMFLRFGQLFGKKLQ